MLPPTYCCWCSITQSCLTHCDSMDCSMPGFPALHHLLEFAQNHVPWVRDAIQLSHPVSSPFPPAFNLSHHDFPASGQSIGASASASVLPMNIQDWFPLGLTGLISLLYKGLFKSLLQHHSLKASILWCSAFLMVPLSRLYMTAGKTKALPI